LGIYLDKRPKNGYFDMNISRRNIVNDISGLEYGRDVDLFKEAQGPKSDGDLAREFRRTGNTEARDLLVCRYLPLVLFLIKWFRRWPEARSDLIQEGNLALLRAAQEYDDTRNDRFRYYAAKVILNAMRAAVANYPVMRSAAKRSKAHLFWWVDPTGARAKIISLDHREPTDDSRKFPVSARLSSQALSPEKAIVAREQLVSYAAEVEQLLDLVARELAAKQFRAFCLRYGLDNGLERRTFLAVGQECGSTKQAVHKLVNRIWTRLGYSGEDWLFDRLEQIKLLEELTEVEVRFHPETGN
jgi:RNA polymerase sigma factor (sigma-70 family)